MTLTINEPVTFVQTRMVRLQVFDGQRWETARTLPDTRIHEALKPEDWRPLARRTWRVIPMIPDNRDGHAVTKCKTHWTKGDLGRLCTRPLGHGNTCVDRVRNLAYGE